jgi:serine/threonine protein kinase
MSHPALPEPERQLGKYHIVRPLKVGGTAAIYLAVLRGENNFSREVVIKRPLPHLVADSRARLMFIDEAHIASRLSHPNICQVLDLVARDDELYLVLEYLKGVDLREILKRCMELGRLLPIEVCAWIAIEVCAGLDVAHEAVAIDGSRLNLIHRDVSPKNIRITDAGSVKVIDFGIARAMNRATETAAGTIKGTLGYMSPEQIMGDDIDRRSDVFAFGICLFQMLTCRNPFDGPTLKERVRRLTQAPVPSPREYNGALDPEIEGIVLKCLERDLDRRYQRMRDVQTDLDRYLAKLQVVSPRQRLIEFLEDIFPQLHETDPELKLVLTEISTVTGRIDTSQRLRFPDDPASETSASSASSASGRSQPQSASTRAAGSAASSTAGVGDTVSTVKDDALSATGSQRTATANGHDTLIKGGSATMNVPVRGVASEAALPSEGLSGISTVLGSKPVRLGGAALAFVGVAALAAVGVIYWLDHRVTTTPIPEETAAVNRGSTPASNAGNTTPTIAATADNPKADTADTASATSTHNANPTRAHPANAGVPSTGGDHGNAVNVAPRERHGNHEAGGATKADASPNRARMYFKTGVRLDSAGHSEDALFMYTLAYYESGKNTNPAIFRNLGILYNKTNDIPKAKACLHAYLDRSPGAPDGDRIRTLISTYPSTRAIACVENSEIQRAKKQAARKGAQIDSWVNETVEEKLR